MLIIMCVFKYSRLVHMTMCFRWSTLTILFITVNICYAERGFSSTCPLCPRSQIWEDLLETLKNRFKHNIILKM